jgi:hypothetical protein
MSLDRESRQAIVSYRIERAYTTLDEANSVAEQISSRSPKNNWKSWLPL